MGRRHAPCYSLWSNDCRPLDYDPSAMPVHLINPSYLSFGVGVITPRWLFVLAGATPTSYGSPRITDETLEPFDIHSVQPGDVVASGFTRATRFGATRSARSRGIGERRSSLAAFTRRSIRVRRRVSAARTPSSGVMATWCGRSCSAMPRMAR
jgi:hypothetical protein